MEWPQGYQSSGQDKYLLSNLRWGMDYLVKAHPAAGNPCDGTGGPHEGPLVWASAEVQTYARQTYTMKSGSCWGADLADSTAATFAAASMAFRRAIRRTPRPCSVTPSSCTRRPSRPRSPSTTPAPRYRPGLLPVLERVLRRAGVGLAVAVRATGDSSYLTKAKGYYGQMPKSGQSPSDPIKYSWTYDWDDKTAPRSS